MMSNVIPEPIIMPFVRLVKRFSWEAVRYCVNWRAVKLFSAFTAELIGFFNLRTAIGAVR